MLGHPEITNPITSSTRVFHPEISDIITYPLNLNRPEAAIHKIIVQALKKSVSNQFEISPSLKEIDMIRLNTIHRQILGRLHIKKILENISVVDF